MLVWCMVSWHLCPRDLASLDITYYDGVLKGQLFYLEVTQSKKLAGLSVDFMEFALIFY